MSKSICKIQIFVRLFPSLHDDVKYTIKYILSDNPMQGKLRFLISLYRGRLFADFQSFFTYICVKTTVCYSACCMRVNHKKYIIYHHVSHNIFLYTKMG